MKAQLILKNNLRLPASSLHKCLNILGLGIFLSVTSCATRTTPPAQVINASQVPAYAQTAATPVMAQPVATPTPPTTAKMEAVTDDEPIQEAPATVSNTAATTKAVSSVPSTPGKNLASSTAGANKNKPVDANADTAGAWKMPTEGAMGAYSTSGKGVDIMGTEGQAINAVANGKVLYSGNGLKGYGNLIIIRHDNSYLSAYAYNKDNLVKEGATVKQGQKIATMGTKDSKAILHLEVRKNGKPIDPHTMIGN
ncbi:MAG: hypothetical protein K0R49_1447 [Burkholderiales bacterium]|jgi:lipoprotein NlpD|nr:hypothetical protein [Burkholderiales bacterium]